MADDLGTLFVYVIGHDEGPQKVGFSGNPRYRAYCLKETGKPHFTVHFAAKVPAADARGVEALAHHILRDAALGRERFDVPPGVAINAVSEAAKRYAAGERVPPREDAMTERLSFIMPTVLVDRIEDWRARQHPIPSFSEAVRVLMDRSLDEQGFPTPNPPSPVKEEG